MSNLKRDPFIDFCGILLEFVTQTRDQLANDSQEKLKLEQYRSKIESSFSMRGKQGNTDEDIITNIIKPVVKSVTSHSKDLLYRNGCMFANELMMFDDSVDVAKLWRKQNSEGKKIMWEFIEQLYVTGYIVCYPEKRSKFLELIRVMKSSSQNQDNQDNEDNDHVDSNTNTPTMVPQPHPQTQTQGTPETQQAVNDLHQMFGLQEGDEMTNMVGDIANHVNGMMQNASPEEQQQMFAKMMQGDMSMFEPMMQNIGSQMEEKIQRGEIDKNALETQAQAMMGKLQGFQQQMGGMMGMMGGLGGMMQGQQPGGMPDLQRMMGGLSGMQQNNQMPSREEILRMQQLYNQQLNGDTTQPSPSNTGSKKQKKSKKTKKHSSK